MTKYTLRHARLANIKISPPGLHWALPFAHSQWSHASCRKSTAKFVCVCVCVFESQLQEQYLHRFSSSANSKHPAHLRSLIWIFTGCILDSQECLVSLWGQWRLWSDCADAQSDLNIHCSYEETRTSEVRYVFSRCGSFEFMEDFFCTELLEDGRFYLYSMNINICSIQVLVSHKKTGLRLVHNKC